MGRIPRLQLEFLGAARTVTGSRTKVTYGNTQLLVDCGLYQGPKEVRIKNWETFEGIKDISGIVLTHAHIDHSGYLPKMAKDGYSGPIFCSEGTFDLCKMMLRDSAYLQEEDAQFFRVQKKSSHKSPKPLYNLGDAERALKLFRPLPSNRWHELFPGISLRLLRAGHIVGSSFMQLAMEKENGVEIVTFSGDVGSGTQQVVKGPVQVQETDYLVLEGTYGDRVHDPADAAKQLADIVNKTEKKGGVLVIPSFAVGRTQELLYMLSALEEAGKIPDLPVYVDSPMANNATDIVLRHPSELRLLSDDSGLHLPLNPKNFKAVRNVDDSRSLCYQSGPFVVISASGMLTGGRILHHIKSRIGDSRNTILFVGYQAEETKGRLLQSGIPKIRIHKELLDVKAEIRTIDSLSAHADCQGLLDWVSHFQRAPKKIFLNHGKYESLRALQYRLRTELAMSSMIPEEGEVVSLW